MELNHLRYFRVVSESGSLTAAARKIGISQPALTVAMRKLEARYGTTLLQRNHRGVKLTPTGQELLRCAVEVFALLEQTEQRVLGLESEEIGRFVIGCYESLGAYFLPHFLPKFLNDYKGIELTLWNDASAAVQDAVVRREVHFGIVVNPVPHPDLVLVELFPDAVDFFTASGEAETLEDAYARIREGPLVFAGRIEQSRELLEALIKADALPARRLSCGDLEMVKSLVMAGLGVGILPRRVAAYGHDKVIVRLHPALPFFPDTIKLVYRADLHRTRAALLVKDALVRCGKQLDPV